MPRLKKADKERKARDSLIETIAKIHDLEPTLGLKWRARMLDYYIGRLAELVLYQAGFSDPNVLALRAIEDGIRATLELV